ncbi:MAG: hypothetical protein Q4A41_03965, partial [Bacillota bacterium]|nr:hypothetical protein [Bacillota bacterium]
MRKLLSIVLALALVLGTLPVFAADLTYDQDGMTAGENLKHYKFIGGDENGNLKEDQMLTREQLAVILASIHGKTDEAKAHDAATGFADEANFTWSKNFISFAKAQGWMMGNDKNM